MPNDTELQQLYIYVGTQAKIDEARQQGTIGPDDFAVVTDAPEFALQSEVQAIQVLIPSSATAQNQLADKDFVNSSINNMAAFYVTSDVQGDPFDTRTDLLAGPWYNQGVERTPTQNDYALVTEDETHDDLTSRYMYDGTQWVWQYTLNNTKFTQAQIDAINSGITSALVSQITTNQNNIGDLTSLTTTTKTSLVSAVNELQSGKQATISDLATIRSGASAGATAVQPSAIANMQTTTNLVTSVSSSSTDTQYPSAKCVYDTSDELLNMIIAEGNLRSDVDDQLNDEINNMTEYLDASVKTTETIPITDYRLLNIPVQYKGATTQDYINGYFYKFTDPVYSSSVTIQTGSFTVTVNNSTFISKANKTGRYFFRKYGTYWSSDLGSILPSSLSSYGITITGTVNTGDKFYIDLSMDTTVTRIDVQPSNAGIFYWGE